MYVQVRFDSLKSKTSQHLWAERTSRGAGALSRGVEEVTVAALRVESYPVKE